MLKKAQVEHHQAFLLHLHDLSIKQIRKKLKTASYLQLMVLIKAIAAVALKQLPVLATTESAFYNSRKKRFLRRHFSSWRKVSALLSTGQQEEWRSLLIELAQLLKPTLSELFTLSPSSETQE